MVGGFVFCQRFCIAPRLAITFPSIDDGLSLLHPSFKANEGFFKIMRPIFFSVASSEVVFAEQIWERLPADLVYLYSKSGAEGEHMWREISDKELANAKFFVVFWSANYVKALGCVRELAAAKQRVKDEALVPLVLRLDNYPIKFSDGLGEDVRQIFADLDALLDFRTSRINMNTNDAVSLVTSVVEPALEDNHPRLIRGELLDNLKKATRRDDVAFACRPAMWISGFNGVGRLSLVRELSRSYHGGSRCIVIDVNETSLPKQVLLHIHDEAFGGGQEALDKLNSDPKSETVEALVSKINSVSDDRRTVVFRHHRVVEESAELPEWIDEVVVALTPTNRTRLFVVSQIPLSASRREHCHGSLGEFRVPTLSEDDTEEFARQLIEHFDPMPERWSNRIADLVRMAGGNPGFLVTVVRSASKIDDPEQIDSLLQRNSERMAESITGYARWAFRQLADFPQEQKALLLLNDISPVHHDDLATMLGNDRPVLNVLGKLLSLGLVERDQDGLYRLTPLLARRLNHDVVRVDAKDWYRSAMQKFAKSAVLFEGDGTDMVKIESRISASLWQGETDLNPEVAKYVSASHWFQVGVRLYHARHRETAYKLLKKAYEKRTTFRDLAKAELTRYFGLSAIRNGRLHEADECIANLSGTFQTRDMAKYLEAFKEESQRNFGPALLLYEEALKLNAHNPRRKERIYRPLIKCIFKSGWPDYSKAEVHALAWRSMRDTVFAKMALAQTYLNWWKKGAHNSRVVPHDIQEKYQTALNDLESQPGVGSGYFEIVSEEAKLDKNYPRAIEFASKAIVADLGRFELRVERWQLMSESRDPTACAEALTEMDNARVNPEFKSNWKPFLMAMTSAYAGAVAGTGKHNAQRVQRFASGLNGEEIAQAIAASNNGYRVFSTDY